MKNLADDFDEQPTFGDRGSVGSKKSAFSRSLSLKVGKRVSKAVRQGLRMGPSQSQSEAKTFLEWDSYQVQDADCLIRRLEEKMHECEGPQVAEELWLDCFLNCVEQAGVVERVRALFKTERQVAPETIEEIRAFDEKKTVYATRLKCFLELIKIKSAAQFHTWIGKVAKTKTKVLEAQTLVFHDYLEALEEKTLDLSTEIDDLRSKTSFLREQLNATI